MKKVATLLFIAAAFLSSCNQGQNKKEQTKDSLENVLPEKANQLSDVISQFVRAYSLKNNQMANDLIHPDLGIKIIYRPGVADIFVQTDSLDFTQPVPEYFPYGDLSNAYTLTFEALPEFDCGAEKWNKKGLICDTISRPNQLTNIINFLSEFEEVSFSKEELQKIELEEKSSFRVILTASEPLIFHVQKYDCAWYVVLLDRAYAGCDA